MKEETLITPINEDLDVEINDVEEIKQKIYLIRGKQVILDSDIAKEYEVETKKLNQAVKRNIKRFPKEFCFQVNENEIKNLRSQIVTSSLNKNNYGGRRYLPYAFTEQGEAMLSAVLHSDKAIDVSIRIMNAFIEMRKILTTNQQTIERLTILEYKQLENENNFNKIFELLENKENIKQKIFFEGQIWDAYSLIIKLIKKAQEKILIIDNYIDDSILDMLSKKKKNVEAIILTSSHSNISKLDIQKFNNEYPVLKLSKINKFHDRFIIIDNKELYHCGASLKDLGKKCFAINKIEDIKYISDLNELCV